MYFVYEFRPSSYHFLSSLFSFLVRGQRKYTSGALLDVLSISAHAGTIQQTFPPRILTWWEVTQNDDQFQFIAQFLHFAEEGSQTLAEKF